MRVIAGTARGRRLVAPKGRDVRPTSDRVKEAVFSSLQAHLLDARVLDLFAGSGALGIEALSRGAAHATFVERANPALSAITRNLATADVADRATVVSGELPAAVARVEGPVDVVLIDPPYALDAAVVDAILAAVAPLTTAGAVWRLEADVRTPAPTWPPLVEPGRVRRYGDTAIHEGRTRPASAPATTPDPEEPA